MTPLDPRTVAWLRYQTGLAIITARIEEHTLTKELTLHDRSVWLYTRDGKLMRIASAQELKQVPG